MFNLPLTTVVNKVIPKNAFEDYTNHKQRKMISEKIHRIIWINKLSKDTINLDGVDIEEIQIFKIELKEQDSILSILNIIDRAIPYTIVYLLVYENKCKVVTSVKHPHPTQTDTSVVDYTFDSEWIPLNDLSFQFQLKHNLDKVFENFCNQISTSIEKPKDLKDLVQKIRNKERLEKDIVKLRSAISRTKEFNKKVELNLQLKKLLDQL